MEILYSFTDYICNEPSACYVKEKDTIKTAKKKKTVKQKFLKTAIRKQYMNKIINRSKTENYLQSSLLFHKQTMQGSGKRRMFLIRSIQIHKKMFEEKSGFF